MLSMAAVKVQAYDAEIDGVYYNFNGDEAYVTNSELYVGNYSKYVGKVVIPEQVTYRGKKYKVTTIMESAFYHSTNEFVGVVLPNSLLTIGKKAFAYCEGLTEITIPNSVKTIEEQAFYFCKGLKTITMGNAVETIGTSCFSGCDGVTALELPNTLKSIGEYALPSKLTSLNIPSSLTTIPKNFYSGANIKSIVIPEGVTTIEEKAFMCNSLESITLPSTLTSIGSNAFGPGYNTANRIQVHIPSLESWLRIPFGVQNTQTNTWTNKHPFAALSSYSKSYSLYVNGQELQQVVIPESFTTIPAYAFYGCQGIKTVTMHNKVTEIEDGAFAQCRTLESVVISNSVTKIKNYAFQQDTIQSLTIGSGVLEIGQSAFGGHDSSYEERSFIKKTIWLTNTPPTNYTNAAGNVNYVSNNLFTFDKDRYRITNLRIYIYPLLSSAFAIDGVKYVPTSMADRTCDAFDAVYDESAALTKLGTTVTYRGVTFKVNNVNPYTCCGNTFVKKAELGEGLPYIADHVFDGCKNLESAKLPETITWLGISSFQNCTSLKEIALPAATTNVLFNAFKGCLSLKNVTMNDGAEQLTLAYNALVSVNYETNKVTVYSGTPLFEDCPLDKVYIGRNIAYGTSKNEGYSPFYRNTSLREVEITDRETEIGENEFYGCSGLKSVKIGDGVTTFGNWAFSGCSSLDYFEFGSSVKTIGKEAFSDCSAVKNVISHTAVPPVCGSQAMDDINKWDCTLTVPNGSTAAYQAADQWKEFLFTQDYDAYKAGVSDITADVDKSAPVYSLSGLRLAAPRKGINIINGKKVVMK